jgi:hypothetical protein
VQFFFCRKLATSSIAILRHVFLLLLNKSRQDKKPHQITEEADINIQYSFWIPDPLG